MIPVTIGGTDQSIDIFISDADSTTGAGKTGLAYNTASLTCYYRRGHTGTPTQITLATLANAQAAHSDGGFVEIDATNMPGAYRLDLPDALAATGVDKVTLFLHGAADMVPLVARIALMDDGADITAIKAKTDNLPADPADESSIQASITAISNTLGVAGAGLTAVPWNSAWDVEVQSEVQDAIEANHLDHLLAADYDPASKPGVATALLNELVESDLGVSRFTANALEQAPSGGGGGDATAANQTTIINHLTDIKGATFDGATDSLESLRNRGDSAWITATGFATSAALATVEGKIDTIDTNVDSILDDTGTAGVALSTASVNAILRTALTEGYASDGSAPTLEQFMYMMWSALAQFDITSTTLTARRLDGTTSAMTFTLNDATNPTSRTRAT